MAENDTDQETPYPRTGYSPALQRTLKAKFDKGEVGGVDKKKFFRQLGKTAKPEQPAEE